jgi:hypothetical protein
MESEAKDSKVIDLSNRANEKKGGLARPPFVYDPNDSNRYFLTVFFFVP